MSNITLLHHITLEIPLGSEQQARQFYGDLLHLTEIPIPKALRNHEHGSVWYAVDQESHQQLHLGPVEEFLPPRRGHGAFLLHDLAALRQALEQAGVLIQEAVPEPGWVRCYAFDPFGNKIELRQLLRPEEEG